MSDDSGQKVRPRSRRPSVKFFLLLWMILALVGECLWYFVGPPRTYTAEAKFERRGDPDTEETRSVRSLSWEAYRPTLEHDLIGREAMTQAAEDEGLTKGLSRGPDGQLTPDGMAARQELVGGLMGGARVRWDLCSEHWDQITVVFTHRNRWVAAGIPNRLVKNYINRTVERISDNLRASLDFMGRQVAESDARLEAQIKKRQEFVNQHRNVGQRDPNLLIEPNEQSEYTKLMEKESEIRKDLESWKSREKDVKMAYAGELSNRRTRLSVVQAAQRPTQPDEILAPEAVACWTLAGGFVLSGLLTLLIWAFRVAPLTTVACLVLLVLVLFVGVVGPHIRSGKFINPSWRSAPVPVPVPPPRRKSVTDPTEMTSTPIEANYPLWEGKESVSVK